MRRYDFRRLKRVISIDQVLEYYGLHRHLRPVRGRLIGTCPLPAHGGDRTHRDAFSVSLGKGLWRCFSSCGGGDIVDLVMQVEQIGFAEAARVLAGLADAPCCSRPRRIEEGSPPRPFRPYTKRLHLDPNHPLLRDRGIRPDLARLFDAGFWPHQGFLRGCIGVRLHDSRGNPLGYVGRRVDPRDARLRGKWKLPSRFPKDASLFGYHRARPHLDSGLIIVEGPFDAIRVRQAGYPNVVALLGTDLSVAQRALLLGAAPKIILMLDGDQAGIAGATRAAVALAPMPLEVVRLPHGKDPSDLTDEALRSILAPLLPLPAHRIMSPIAPTEWPDSR